jgi:hypothetical protein
MNLLKDDATTRIDVAMGLADETTDLYRDLREHLENPALVVELEAAISEQTELLGELRSSRQARDDLPQAGDPERAHLRALLAEVQGFLKSVTASAASGASSDMDAQLVQAIVEATSRLDTELENAAQCDLPPNELRLLDRYRQSCASLDRALRNAS